MMINIDHATGIAIGVFITVMASMLFDFIIKTLNEDNTPDEN